MGIDLISPYVFRDIAGQVVNKAFNGIGGRVDMTADQAEVIALRALGWLAAQDELWPVFLGATGADPATLRDAAADPVFLGSVLDFLTQDDAWVVAFCTATGLPFTEPMQARQALPGGAQVHWT